MAVAHAVVLIDGRLHSTTGVSACLSLLSCNKHFASPVLSAPAFDALATLNFCMLCYHLTSKSALGSVKLAMKLLLQTMTTQVPMQPAQNYMR